MGPTRMLARAIAVVVLAAGFAAVAPEPAQAVPGTPGALTATAANPPVLSWSRATSAVTYEVQVDDDPAFVSPEFTVTTVNTRAVPTNVLHEGQQFWRVRAADASRVVGPWAQSSFAVDPVPAPTSLTPDAVTLQQPDSPPLLSWDEVRGAEAYVVQLDDEEDTEYVGAREYTTKVTSLVVPEALPTGDAGESYRWRVKAIRDTGVESVFSTDAIFELEPIDAVTLVSPADGATVQDVVLDWQPLPGAQYYELQVSTDDNFSVSTVIDDRTGNRKIYGTRYSPPVTYDNNTYYWRVRAVDTAGNPSAWSDTTDLRSFVRAWSGVAHVPRLVSPADNAVRGAGLHFQWTRARHASMYELQTGTDPSFSPGTFSSCIVLGTTYTPGALSINDLTGDVRLNRPHDLCTPSAGVRTYWRVRPLDLPFVRSGTGTQGVQGIYSETRSVVFKPGTVDDSAVQMTPAHRATVDVPVLSWDAVQGTTHYEISIWDRTGNPVVTKKRTSATSYVPVVPTALTADKSPYEWSLTAWGADRVPKTLEMHQTFSISGNDPGEGPWAGASTPLTPLTANSTADPTRRPPLMAWEPMPGAAYYRVFAGPANSGTLFPESSADVFGTDVELPHPAVTDTHTWLLDPGEYEWRVVAYSEQNAPLGSGPTATFRIGPLDPVSGIRLAIDGDTFGPDRDGGFTAPLSCTPATCGDAPSTPVISWDPVEDAGLYLVYLSEDPEFTNVVEDLTSLPATTNTRWTPNFAQEKSALAESLAGGSYYLHIRPCVDSKHCRPRPVSTSGMATNKFRKKSPPVVLEQPAPGAEVPTGEIVFDWQDYRATSEAAPWSETGETGAQSAMWYRIQVDDNANFASPIDEIRVDQSTYTAFDEIYPEGPLYWRVQAIDADANDLTWSETRTFTKKTAAVRLSTPLPGAIRRGTTVFRWEPSASAASYEIELFKNNDTTFSSANRVFGRSVKQTAYVWNDVIPSSAVPYVWRVRSVDPSGNKGPWSAPRAFTSATEEPVVEGPPTGSYLQGDEILLRWTSVAGATSYEVDLTSPTGSLAERVDTKATAYAPSRTLDDGTWQWKVVAENASGHAIGSTGWSTFVVDENGPRVVEFAPDTVKVRSNLVITFSEPVKNVTRRTYFLKRDGTRRKVAAVVTLSADKLSAKLNPSRRLRRNSSYTLKVTARVTDLRDNPLAPYDRGLYVQ